MRMHEEDRLNMERRASAQPTSVNDKLVIRLRDLSHTMRALYEGKGSQRRVLIVLSESGTMTQQALTKRLGIQPGSASEVIAKLESAGLIARTPSAADRRTADIVLTEEGKALAQQAVEQRIRRHEEMFSSLTAEEKEQLLVLLNKVAADWEERYRGARDARPNRRPDRRDRFPEDGASCPLPKPDRRP